MVIAADDGAADHGLEPLAVVRSWASVGVPPEDTGLAPTIGIPKALTRAGLSIDDIDLWEINEAFDSMCVATTRILGIDEAKVNVLGSGDRTSGVWGKSVSVGLDRGGRRINNKKKSQH